MKYGKINQFFCYKEVLQLWLSKSGHRELNCSTSSTTNNGDKLQLKMATELKLAVQKFCPKQSCLLKIWQVGVADCFIIQFAGLFNLIFKKIIAHVLSHTASKR